MASNSETIYIKAGRNTEVKKPDITLGEVLEITCVNSINGSKSPVSSPVKRNQRSCSGIGAESRFYDTGSVSERRRAEYRRA